MKRVGPDQPGEPLLLGLVDQELARIIIAMLADDAPQFGQVSGEVRQDLSAAQRQEEAAMVGHDGLVHGFAEYHGAHPSVAADECELPLPGRLDAGCTVFWDRSGEVPEGLHHPFFLRDRTRKGHPSRGCRHDTPRDRQLQPSKSSPRSVTPHTS